MFLLPLTKTGNLTMDREQAQREAGGKGRRAKDTEDAGNRVSRRHGQCSRCCWDVEGNNALVVTQTLAIWVR